MSDRKGWGSTVAGWFIERDEAPTPVETDIGDVPDPTPPPATENYTTPSPTQSVFKKRRHRRLAVRSTLPPCLQLPASIRMSSSA